MHDMLRWRSLSPMALISPSPMAFFDPFTISLYSFFLRYHSLMAVAPTAHGMRPIVYLGGIRGRRMVVKGMPGPTLHFNWWHWCWSGGDNRPPPSRRRWWSRGWRCKGDMPWVWHHSSSRNGEWVIYFFIFFKFKNI